MLKRIAILSVALVGLTAGPAFADETQYPPTDDHEVTVSATALCPGDSLVVEGRTFAPGSPVLIELLNNDSTLGTVTAGEDGSFHFETTVPEDQDTGDYTVQASGTDAAGEAVSLTASLTVDHCADAPPPADEAGPPAGDLPVTGSNTTMTLIQVGLALAALGGIMLALARRRRNAAHLRTA